MEARAAWEAKMLGQLEDGAAALSAQREKQTAQFKRQAGNNTSSGQHKLLYGVSALKAKRFEGHVPETNHRGLRWRKRNPK